MPICTTHRVPYSIQDGCPQCSSYSESPGYDKGEALPHPDEARYHEHRTRELDRLTVFLYIIARDHLPFGVLNEIIADHVGGRVVGRFGDDIGSALASSLAHDILDRPNLGKQPTPTRTGE